MLNQLTLNDFEIYFSYYESFRSNISEKILCVRLYLIDNE